jgi:hypothetical protein
MGKDCESLLSGITSIKKSLDDGIVSLAGELASSTVVIDTSISVNEDSHSGTLKVDEKEKTASSSSYFSAVQSAISESNTVIGQMKTLGSQMYVSEPEGFNNSYGSPWKEINRLSSILTSVETYANAHSTMKHVGEKAGLIGLMSMAASACVDAKWALITYNDYVQRGFDTKYNNNTPSITFARTKNRRTTGNITQPISENVHIADESTDPY